jgi:hypothetical protein
MRAGGRLGFTLPASEIRNSIYTPRYYDPAIEERLDELRVSHELVSLQELIDTGDLELRQGKYISKMYYGTGPVPYIRTSDIANWELRGSPKHGMSETIAAEYREHADVREMDVLLVHEGTYLIGTSCLITHYDTDILFQHHLAKLRSLDGHIDGPLLMAFLLAPIVQRQIRARQFTADVIDSIVGRLPEVKVPLHRSPERLREIAERAYRIFAGRADARVRLAMLARGLDEAVRNGGVSELIRRVRGEELEGSAHVAFLGDRFGAESFTVRSGVVKGDVLVPRYYDPTTENELRQMSKRADLVSIGELVESGVLELQTGEEVGKLAYGEGSIAFVRTSDFGNWELKHDPKQRISRDVYEEYSKGQSTQADDVLLVRDGTYLVGSTTIVHTDDLPLLFSGGIYRLRVKQGSQLSPTLLLALCNMRVVRRQIRNKQFTRDVIDTLGHRIKEVVLPLPSSVEDRDAISETMRELLEERASLRSQAAELGPAVEYP